MIHWKNIFYFYPGKEWFTREEVDIITKRIKKDYKMNTYTFMSKNTSVVITLSAETEDEAFQEVEELVREGMNDFRLDQVEEEDE